MSFIRQIMAKIIIICGPTCVGKTAVGIEIARRYGGEIVSADSQQVYKELNIGTAKPSAEDRARTPHHLIDVVRPDEKFDVASFVELADKTIAEISGRGRLPVVVGGTGLYIRALCRGLAQAPLRDDNFRAEMDALKKKHGAGYLHDMLAKADPASAVKLKRNDSARIIRALEVVKASGKSIAEFQKEHGFRDRRYDYLKIGLNIDRAELYRRINERVDEMIAAGLEKEAKSLAEKYGAGCQALKAVGYREFLIKNTELPARPPADLIKQNTRRYAKRQLTWFKADKEITWFEPADLNAIFLFIDRQLVRC